ncbi:MAG TPA: helix-turn-helix domain-containing protein [Smithella sp.]|nr:helix-turn-helix domain-containing protein [Smithella sp.]
MKPILICINDAQRDVLESWSRKETINRRLPSRALIILLSASGERRWAIARYLGINQSVVTKWKKRFVAFGIDGLLDRSRAGRPRKYNNHTEKRVLSVLDKQPPSGFSHWNRFLIATELGDVTAHEVWRVLRKNEISLDYRRS